MPVTVGSPRLLRVMARRRFWTTVEYFIDCDSSRNNYKSARSCPLRSSRSKSARVREEEEEEEEEEEIHWKALLKWNPTNGPRLLKFLICTGDNPFVPVELRQRLAAYLAWSHCTALFCLQTHFSTAMTDPLGLTASVTAVATIAYKSSHALYEVIDIITEPPENIVKGSA